MIKKTIGLFIGLLTLGALTPGWSLTISPSRTQAVLMPGESKNMVLTVFNEETQKVQVDVSEKDWFVLPANQSIPTASWLKLHGTKQFILKPYQTRKVKVTLAAPKSALGELVGMTSFKYRGETPSMVLPMISVSIYLAIAGTEKSSGTISNLLVAGLPDRLRVMATVNNSGNVHLRPIGSLNILGDDGILVKQLSVPENSAPTYPGTERPYVADAMAYQLKPGNYTVAADLQSEQVSLKSQRRFTVATDGKIMMDDKK